MATDWNEKLCDNPENPDDAEDGFADLAKTRRFAGNPGRTTIWRWCREGRFPAPEKLGPGRRGRRRRSLREWARDPEKWAAEQRESTREAEREVRHDPED